MTHIIELVCTLPIHFRTSRIKTPKQVVRKLKLRQHRSEVNLEKIIAYLAENTDLLELWLRWSEDKRWSPAWYFTERKPNWLVGFYPDGPEFIFSEPIEACAVFVEKELDVALSWQ
jgi:hypothetical protein